MKKILFAALAAVAFMGTACKECTGDSCATKGAANDSLSAAYGTYVGAVISNEMSSPEADKDAFVKGFKQVMASKDDQNTRYGMQVALQILNEINQLSDDGVVIDKTAVMKAFLATYKSDSLSVNDIRNAQSTFRKMFEDAQHQAALAAQNASATTMDANKAAGAEYVAKLAGEDPSVVTLPSGLVYKVEKAGEEGTNPDETATVRVHYIGRHLDGRVFDSSVERGEPAVFNLQGVVPGFREGLMQLGKGGKATLYIPGELAYGANGAPQAGIQPNEMLVFDVELLDVMQ